MSSIDQFVHETNLFLLTVGDVAKAVAPKPLFGNGDIINYEDYNDFKSKSGAAGCMLARGALVKPWVFTEIKEQRHWDISAQERLDMVRDYVNYGLEHWGSDDKGIFILFKLIYPLRASIEVGPFISAPSGRSKSNSYRSDFAVKIRFNSCLVVLSRGQCIYF